MCVQNMHVESGIRNSESGPIQNSFQNPDPGMRLTVKRSGSEKMIVPSVNVPSSSKFWKFSSFFIENFYRKSNKGNSLCALTMELYI